MAGAPRDEKEEDACTKRARAEPCLLGRNVGNGDDEEVASRRYRRTVFELGSMRPSLRVIWKSFWHLIRTRALSTPVAFFVDKNNQT
eukprot:764269-Hanusia_phi.AAC.1